MSSGRLRFSASRSLAPRRRLRFPCQATAVLAILTVSVSQLYTFVGSSLRPLSGKEEIQQPKEVRLNVLSFSPEVETISEEGLLPGERYVASNRFMVREGAEAAFEQRWAQRKSSLITLPGFRWFSLMRRVPPSGENVEPYPDEYSYISFTIWETKDNFDFWRKGPAFKEAHGGGGIFDFLGMIVSSFLTSKGPPKPAFWRGLLLEKTSDLKERLISGPGGRPDADGSQMLQPEVFVSMNRFSVAQGREKEFEQRWANRESHLNGLPGFRYFQLLRRDQTPDDDCNYISMAVWDDRAAFDNWKNGEGFKQAHGGGGERPKEHDSSSGGPMGGVLTKPPRPYFYEGKLVLESEMGA